MEQLSFDLDQDFEFIFKPRLSGHLIKAYYSELIKKQESGILLTEKVQNDTFDEVLKRFQ
ncbi:MAG: hypothetical protein M0P57_04285 [Syntrophales bacterium]|jgi:hypothetical protein|nr:hypothetical protein [Syntrophales bacterium]MDY0044190.1 hypothetical protein [Syntrophales bacterium]